MMFLIKEFFGRIWWILTTHKCKAEGCDRRLKGKYKWCGLECYVYDGGKLNELRG